MNDFINVLLVIGFDCRIKVISLLLTNSIRSVKVVVLYLRIYSFYQKLIPRRSFCCMSVSYNYNARGPLLIPSLSMAIIFCTENSLSHNLVPSKEFNFFIISIQFEAGEHIFLNQALHICLKGMI